MRGHLGGGVRPVQLTRTQQVGEGVGEGGREAGPFAGQQVSVDHLTEQGVTAAVQVRLALLALVLLCRDTLGQQGRRGDDLTVGPHGRDQGPKRGALVKGGC